MRLRSAKLVLIGLVVFSLFAAMANTSKGEDPLAEPSLVTILHTLGYTNIALTSAQTFSAGTYEARLLAEFGSYCDTNEFSYYAVGTSNFILLFSGPQGNYGYVTPPVTTVFSSGTTFGCSMYVVAEDHRYFTQTSRNPDGRQHAKVYRNLDVTGMYFIGFENMYGSSADRDYNDMVVCLCPPTAEYYLTVQTQPTGITTIPGEGWYSQGTDVVLTAPATVSVSTGVRYSFGYWDVDGASQGAGVNPITVDMSANHTATAHYTLQYYLTVVSPYGTPGGAGWYDSGATAYATLDTGAVDHGNGTRHVFTSWTGDASGTSYVQSNPITMSTPKTAVACWKTQYYLTMNTNFGSVSPGNGWFDAGSTFSITATPPSAVSGERYVWNGWTGSGSGSYSGTDNPASITMNAPISEGASWTHQYYLTVISPFDTPGGEGWYDSGSTAYGTLAVSSVDHGNGTRRVFTSWSGDASGTNYAQSDPIVMNAPKTAVANWKTQYYLTITYTSGGVTDPASSGWYDAGTTVPVTAIPDLDYVLDHWELDGSPVGSVNPYSVLMNSAHTLHAVFEYSPPPPTEYYLTVKTDPLGITSIPGEGWYNEGEDAVLTAPSYVTVSTGVRYSFDYWDVDGGSQGAGVNPITVDMSANHTATAHYTLQYCLTVVSPYGTTSGQGWYDSGATTYADVDTGTIDHGNGTRRVFTAWSGDASGTNYAQSDPITMNGPKTALANWKTQYLLTLATNPSGITTPSGEGWFDAGAYAPISTTDLVDIIPGSSRYKFTDWTTADMPEITDPSSPSTTVLVDKPKTVTANYKTQYYLTITYTSGGVTDPASSGWYDAGTTVPVTAIPDLDYVLDHWELDGSPVGSVNPYSVLMNSAHTLHAVFEYTPPPPVEYYLTVKTDPLGITSISGEGWYEEGEDVALTAPEYVDVSAGTRHKFAYWDVDGTPRGAGVMSITVDMDANHTATAHYTLQYYLTVYSPYDTPTPTSGWFDGGTSITDSVTSPWPGTTGTRYVCTGWTGSGSVPASGTSSSVSFTINAPSSITWTWKTQYYLTVATVPSGIAVIPGAGWYDASSSVPLTAPDVSGYDFLYWDIGGIGQGSGVQAISVTMSGPKAATAHYASVTVGGSTKTIEFQIPYAWAAVHSLLAAAFCVVAFRTRKKRKTA